MNCVHLEAVELLIIGVMILLLNIVHFVWEKVLFANNVRKDMFYLMMDYPVILYAILSIVLNQVIFVFLIILLLIAKHVSMMEFYVIVVTMDII